MMDLSQQTEALVKALDQLHRDSVNFNMTAMIASTVITALLLIIAFKRSK